MPVSVVVILVLKSVLFYFSLSVVFTMVTLIKVPSQMFSFPSAEHFLKKKADNLVGVGVWKIKEKTSTSFMIAVGDGR